MELSCLSAYVLRLSDKALNSVEMKCAMSNLVVTGDGDKCDIPPEDCEGSGRRAHPRHQGPRSHHRSYSTGNQGRPT